MTVKILGTNEKTRPRMEVQIIDIQQPFMIDTSPWKQTSGWAVIQEKLLRMKRILNEENKDKRRVLNKKKTKIPKRIYLKRTRIRL